jgi:acetyl esterase/lipase
MSDLIPNPDGSSPQRQKFDAALKAKGASSTFIVVTGASHTFPQVKGDAIRPYTQQIYAWLDAHTHH